MTTAFESTGTEPTLDGAPSDTAPIVRRVDDVVVVAPQGVLDADAMRDVDQAVMATGAPVVIDLRDRALGDPELLDLIDPDRWGRSRDDVCVASRRLSARRLLAMAGVTQRLAVFQRREDALQVRVHADAGYGSGWRIR